MPKAKLCTKRELRDRARKTKKRLNELFEKPELAAFSAHKSVGLARINEKLAFALMLADHMSERKVSLEKLGDLLFIEGERFEALCAMRSPTAFAPARSQAASDEYLLALCSLEWDPRSGSFVPFTLTVQ